MSDNQEKYKHIFDDGNEAILIVETKRLLSIRERLKQEAVKDVSKTPTPNLLSTETNIPVEYVIELLDFADTGMLSDMELSMIHDRASGFVDINGNPTTPNQYPGQPPFSEEY